MADRIAVAGANDVTSLIAAIVEENEDRFIEIRRRIHEHPEIAFEEVRTAALVAETLGSLGIEHQTGIGRTGVVGHIRGKRPGPTLLIRADMDALPMQEQTGLPYASKLPNRMHACGHDLHTATVLAVGAVLKRLEDRLAGNVRLVFQPAEEAIGGAKEMIADGVMDGVDMALSLHNRPEIPVGQFGIVHGYANAAVDSFDILIRGKGGHAARPHAAIDPIVMSAQLISQLQTIVSRNVRALDACVVTVGSIHAGEARNIIPETCELKGTIRSRQPEARDAAEAGLRRICEGVASSFGASCELAYRRGTPPIFNDKAMLERTVAAIKSQIGDVAFEYEPSMGGEDFALMAEMVPSFRLLVGSSQPGRSDKVHSPVYQPDEGSIALGTLALARTAFDILA
ncbi:M20 family metallopeptidase [Mesorhizobium sp. RMAD-H1]|uniref:M20 metallopeptidase family protein n=1 Tax=Mesorhizobium sp. RMAD-H1 TaxID=2587065 RepID=UPI001612449A|nr:M20 family metallopeptidase [Mesorhizobium sp. RMAD-H1]MBB2973179.1 amidohydrolase [Mesorhizobium sp. RMAD-H1]